MTNHAKEFGPMPPPPVELVEGAMGVLRTKATTIAIHQTAWLSIKSDMLLSLRTPRVEAWQPERHAINPDWCEIIEMQIDAQPKNPRESLGLIWPGQILMALGRQMVHVVKHIIWRLAVPLRHAYNPSMRILPLLLALSACGGLEIATAPDAAGSARYCQVSDDVTGVTCGEGADCTTCPDYCTATPQAAASEDGGASRGRCMQ
jgi:hypothetical protein